VFFNLKRVLVMLTFVRRRRWRVRLSYGVVFVRVNDQMKRVCSPVAAFLC
jgi:hypothetical protein